MPIKSRDRSRSHSHRDPKMSKKKSDLMRRRSTRTRRAIAGKEISAAAGDRPEWLPEDWTMEIKKRGKSCTKIKRIDRYYICPLSGKRLRSRLEVMRVLNNKFLGHSASESASRDGGYQQLPTVEVNRSEVKRTIARRHQFAREEPLSDAITEIKLADLPQESALSSLTHASAQLDNGASDTSCLTAKNVEHLDQRISESQIECEPNPTDHIEEQPAIKVLPEPGNEMLSEPLVYPEDEMPVPDANTSEKAECELTKKRSQPQRHKRHGSSNIEAVGSVNNGHSLRKRTAEKRESIPTRTSKRLAGVTAEPISNFGTEKKLKSPMTTQIEQTQPIVPEETHEKDASITVEEEAKCLNPFEEAPKDQQADELQPTVPMDTDAGCSSHRKDTPKTDELKEQFEPVEPFVEQASQEQHPNDPLTNALPFGDSWSDPCIEFAFKTLTSDFPVLEDIAAIQDYFNHQCISSESLNLSVRPSSSAFGGPLSLFLDDDRPCPLENGKAELSNPTSKKTL